MRSVLKKIRLSEEEPSKKDQSLIKKMDKT